MGAHSLRFVLQALRVLLGMSSSEDAAEPALATATGQGLALPLQRLLPLPSPLPLHSDASSVQLNSLADSQSLTPPAAAALNPLTPPSKTDGEDAAPEQASEEAKQHPQQPTALSRASPEESASWLSTLWFCWISPLIAKVAPVDDRGMHEIRHTLFFV